MRADGIEAVRNVSGAGTPGVLVALLLLLAMTAAGCDGGAETASAEAPAEASVLPAAGQESQQAEEDEGEPAEVAGAEAPEEGVYYVTGASGIRIPRTESAGPTGEWWLPSLDYANSRYSQLDQITSENVSELEMHWAQSTGVTQGHEGNPLVVGNTMYAVTPFPNFLLAFDLTTEVPTLKWKFEPHPDPTAYGKACCDVVNRGAQFADGKIVYQVLDGNVVAVDAETGDLEWMTKVAYPEQGETLTTAPLVIGDVVIAGNSGGELGVHGWAKGLDLQTGEVLWTGYNTGPDSITLMTDPNFDPWFEKDEGDDLGVRTWPPEQWRLGGSTVWGYMSWDPTTNQLFYGTGNPGVWNPDIRPGSNHWSASIIARNPQTGQATWGYQVVPHDAWDYDEIMENVVLDIPWEGEMRQVIVHPGRTGFVFILDRVTGELLSAEKFYPHTNWAEEYSLETGLPLVNEEKRTHMGVVTRDICPASTGAKEFSPSAVSPETGYMYIPTQNLCMNYEGIEANYIAGTPYLGASVMMYPGPGGYRGSLIAWDIVNAREVWKVEENFPLNGGVLATKSNLVFYGTMDGWFKALDATTGEVLWKKHLGSGLVSNPMTYIGPDGRQYIAVYAGVGGWLGVNAFEWVSADDPTASLGTMGGVGDLKQHTIKGGMIYVFSL